jgi:hypothetical protein
MPTKITTDGISQESIERLVEGLVIHNLAWYVNPSGIHLFLSPDPLRYEPCTLLTIYALDDGTLHVGLQGPDVPESPNDRKPEEEIVP